MAVQAFLSIMDRVGGVFEKEEFEETRECIVPK